jgi:hypothetical protein
MGVQHRYPLIGWQFHPGSHRMRTLLRRFIAVRWPSEERSTRRRLGLRHACAGGPFACQWPMPWDLSWPGVVSDVDSPLRQIMVDGYAVAASARWQAS